MNRAYEFRVHFVWRRVFRSPTRSVVRGDVVEALGISTTAASTLLSFVADNSNDLLHRDGNKVVASPWAQAPHWADEADLMEALDSGRTSFAETGLRPSELPVNFSSWSCSMPAAPGALSLIVEACTRKLPVYIEYVGLNTGDTARYRRVFPVALERMNDQWRLAAHDLERNDYPILPFVLSRITGAAADRSMLPKGFTPSRPNDTKQRIQIDWDIRLNEDQRRALCSELGVDSKGGIHLNSREVFDFAARFGNGSGPKNLIWPPLRPKD